MDQKPHQNKLPNIYIFNKMIVPIEVQLNAAIFLLLSTVITDINATKNLALFH